jgi:hypothetical protein
LSIVALVLAVLLLVTACATSAPAISEEGCCTRFGGLWQLGACQQAGSAGGGM